MHEYLPMVREVLHYVIDAQLRTRPLSADFQPIFRRLVYSAAWQESCWRQFEAKNNMRVPVQSSTGDVGMMQINPKVWRGFYDLQGLRWDIVYNARAGADILQHHLVNYGIGKNEHRVTGSSDSLARAAYAAYNGGPRQYDRYRRSNAPAQGRKVDELFREKYQAVKQKGEMAVRACYGG
jgi:soluble lytic murein transglycosylase-like protein